MQVPLSESQRLVIRFEYGQRQAMIFGKKMYPARPTTRVILSREIKGTPHLIEVLADLTVCCYHRDKPNRNTGDRIALTRALNVAYPIYTDAERQGQNRIIRQKVWDAMRPRWQAKPVAPRKHRAEVRRLHQVIARLEKISAKPLDSQSSAG